MWKLFKKEEKERQCMEKLAESKKSCIASLDDYEKATLREFRIKRKNAIKMPINDSTVAGLLDRKILRLVLENVEPVLSANMGICSINPEFEEYINEKSLGFPMEQSDLLSKRPDWTLTFDRLSSEKPWFFSR